jgi:hypothetical protein
MTATVAHASDAIAAWEPFYPWHAANWRRPTTLANVALIEN